MNLSSPRVGATKKLQWASGQGGERGHHSLTSLWRPPANLTAFRMEHVCTRTQISSALVGEWRYRLAGKPGGGRHPSHTYFAFDFASVSLRSSDPARLCKKANTVGVSAISVQTGRREAPSQTYLASYRAYVSFRSSDPARLCNKSNTVGVSAISVQTGRREAPSQTYFESNVARDFIRFSDPARLHNEA